MAESSSDSENETKYDRNPTICDQNHTLRDHAPPDRFTELISTYLNRSPMGHIF